MPIAFSRNDTRSSVPPAGISATARNLYGMRLSPCSNSTTRTAPRARSSAQRCAVHISPLQPVQLLC